MPDQCDQRPGAGAPVLATPADADKRPREDAPQDAGAKKPRLQPSGRTDRTSSGDKKVQVDVTRVMATHKYPHFGGSTLYALAEVSVDDNRYRGVAGKPFSVWIKQSLLCSPGETPSLPPGTAAVLESDDAWEHTGWGSVLLEKKDVPWDSVSTLRERDGSVQLPVHKSFGRAASDIVLNPGFKAGTATPAMPGRAAAATSQPTASPAKQSSAAAASTAAAVEDATATWQTTYVPGACMACGACGACGVCACGAPRTHALPGLPSARPPRPRCGDAL